MIRTFVYVEIYREFSKNQSSLKVRTEILSEFPKIGKFQLSERFANFGLEISPKIREILICEVISDEQLEHFLNSNLSDCHGVLSHLSENLNSKNSVFKGFL